MAWITGLFLLALVFVAMPLKYMYERPTAVHVIGPIHGALYAIYLLTALQFTAQRNISLPKTLALLLAGLVPFASFFADRYAVKVSR